MANVLAKKGKLVDSELSTYLTRDQVKLCFEKVDRLQKKCIFCGKVYNTNGNTTNEKSHLLSRHKEILLTNVRKAKKPINNLTSTASTSKASQEEQQQHQDVHHIDEDDEDEDACEVHAPTAKRTKTINDFFHTNSKAPICEKRQISLEEAVKNARKQFSDQTSSKVLRSGLIRFLCKLGVPFNMVTKEDLESLSHPAYLGLESVENATNELQERVSLLKSMVSRKIDEAGFWAADLQIWSLNREITVAALVVYFYDDSDDDLHEAILWAKVEVSADMNSNPEILRSHLKHDLEKLGISWADLRCVLNHSEMATKVIKPLMPSGARLYDCAMSLTERVTYHAFSLDIVQQLKVKLRSLHQIAKKS
ncbi:Hypothetical predicted protein [Cloeon dipterum]|uniref:BED-type domain-containing protein n=1 Tax=Cloeon dipterum TaxID=197152 RepID=A0A8S1CSL3_9INSE|nr:Hypothetical predicted protein [Cloeon dipterum]